MVITNQIENINNHTLIKEGSYEIIEIHCSSDFIYEAKHIKEIHKILQEISKAKNKKLLILILFKEYTTVTLETLIYISKGQHKRFIEAEAFKIQSPSQRFMLRYLINCLSTQVKAKYFAKKGEAEEWLNLFVKDL